MLGGSWLLCIFLVAVNVRLPSSEQSHYPAGPEIDCRHPWRSTGHAEEHSITSGMSRQSPVFGSRI